ncbi:MAG: DUF6152 family protein [Hyphomicrobiaceae bacterium]|nr:DUF6152 family protein [Hyphomicrobiaceae bacterium]
MFRVAGLLLGLAVLLIAAPTSAHHSFVGSYDSTKLITLKGTVTKVRYGNPHIFFSVDVPGKGVWKVEAESISKTRAKGLTKDHLKRGAPVTVTGWPSRKGKPAIGLQSIIVPGGKVIKIRGTAR